MSRGTVGSAPVRENRSLDPLRTPQLSARRARLIYVSDSTPGIVRRRCGRRFEYRYPTGRKVTAEHVLVRIHSHVIPPAWSNVWICLKENGHLQVTGRDARGRKQYRYHPRWQQIRDEAKYQNVIAFALALPGIRRRVERDLRRRGLPRDKVLAAIVSLLETTLIRVGNPEYARENGSFGLTTLQDGHAHVKGSRIRFEFRGKSGISHEINLQDARLASIVRQCQELPGQELFQYVDEQGIVRDVGSSDVNEYLKRISGHDFTAKDFRTWAGTALAARILQQFAQFDSPAAARRNVAAAIQRVAERLGNTRAICRKCYVHPAIIEAYLDESLFAGLQLTRPQDGGKTLGEPCAESTILAFLQRRMERKVQAVPEAMKKKSGDVRTRRSAGVESSSRKKRLCRRPS